MTNASLIKRNRAQSLVLDSDLHPHMDMLKFFASSLEIWSCSPLKIYMQPIFIVLLASEVALQL